MILNLVALSTLTLTQVLCTSSTKFDKLVFEDNFDTLDSSKWLQDTTNPNGGLDNEFQFYSDNKTIIYVKEGLLNIQPKLLTTYLGITNEDLKSGLNTEQCFDLEDCPGTKGQDIANPVVSGKLTTKETFKCKYGKVEIRAKFPQGDWLVPSIRLLPANDIYKDKLGDNQIIIGKAKGNLPTDGNNGINKFESGLSWGSKHHQMYYGPSIFEHYLEPGHYLSERFNKFTVEWDKDSIKHYFNDELITESNTIDRVRAYNYKGNTKDGIDHLDAPFDQEYYVSISLAVGGTLGNEFMENDEWMLNSYGNKPWSDKSSTPKLEFLNDVSTWYPTWKKRDFVIDYVKIYQ